MSDAFWNSLFTAIPSILTVVMTVVLAIMGARTKAAVEKAGTDATKAANNASEKADEVREQLDVTGGATEKKLENLAKVANDTHTLVNSNMEKALQISSIALRRVADLTKDEGDIRAAEIAEKALADHIEKQVKVDARVEKQAVTVAATEAATTAVVDAQQKTLGGMARETMSDVKEVKRDVKDLKDDQ